MSPSSTIRLSDPEVSSWRRMLSCQGDWPSCCSRINGLAIAVSSRPDAGVLPARVTTDGHRFDGSEPSATRVLTSSRASRATTCSAVKPNSFMRRRSRERRRRSGRCRSIRPHSPTHRCQPERDSRLDRERRLTRRGQHGSRDSLPAAPRTAPSTASTRAAPRIPLSASIRSAATTSCTSEPVAMQHDVGRVQLRIQHVRAAASPSAGRTASRSSVGRFCRVSANTVGRWRFSIATRHA